jgi:hypothetical protein
VVDSPDDDIEPIVDVEMLPYDSVPLGTTDIPPKHALTVATMIIWTFAGAVAVAMFTIAFVAIATIWIPQVEATRPPHSTIFPTCSPLSAVYLVRFSHSSLAITSTTRGAITIRPRPRLGVLGYRHDPVTAHPESRRNPNRPISSGSALPERLARAFSRMTIRSSFSAQASRTQPDCFGRVWSVHVRSVRIELTSAFAGLRHQPAHRSNGTA